MAIDLWPDVTELGPDELCDTGLKLPSGRPAYLFSSENPKSVLRHFRWMRENDIDGVALQRFLHDSMEPNTNERLLTVTRNVRAAAERTGVGFFVMYDISGANAATAADAIARDWQQFVVGQKILESPAYIRHRGKPVIGIWGLGLKDRPESAEQAMAIIRSFRDRDVTLMGGVPAHWRTLDGDSRPDPGWGEVYRSFDIVSPWTPGRYASIEAARKFAVDVQAGDLAETRRRGQDYMPVIFPGYSGYNLHKGQSPLDQIPRDCGAFYLAQAEIELKLGASMIYTAMFDEVNEGIAIFKIVRRQEELPAGVAMLAPDDQRCGTNSDYYLKSAKDVSEALRRQSTSNGNRPPDFLLDTRGR
jgi:hypothetical protein